MNLMAPPRRTAPKMTRITPAMMVAAASPSTPCRCTMAYPMTTNAPVGPPICTRDPPKAEMRNPATIAVKRPRSGVTPLAIANAIASGNATMPTMTPATRSDANCDRLYDLSVVTDFGTSKNSGQERTADTTRRVALQDCRQTAQATAARDYPKAAWRTSPELPNCQPDGTPIVSVRGSSLLLSQQIPRADPARAGAGGDQPGFLAARSAHLPSRHRRLRDAIPRVPDFGVHQRRRHPPPHGDGCRFRLARRQEFPGLLRQHHRPASGRRDVFGRHQALARAAVLRLRGSAQRRDTWQAPESSLRRREVHLALHQPDLHHSGRRRLRSHLRVFGALGHRAGVSGDGAAARHAQLGVEWADQEHPEGHRGRDDGIGGIDNRVAAQHRVGEEPWPRRPGSGAAQRDDGEDPQARAEEGEVHQEPELHPGHVRQSPAHADPVYDAVPDFHPEDHRRAVLLTALLFVLHFRPDAGAGQHYQRISGDRSLTREFQEDSGDAKGPKAGRACAPHRHRAARVR